MSTRDGEDLIRRHYRLEAEKHGDSACSTMEDEIVREREVRLINRFLQVIRGHQKEEHLRILDLGCGNGYTLSAISAAHPHSFWGLDISTELLSIARTRQLSCCSFAEGSALDMPFAPESFDIVYTERCLINILRWEEQQRALREIHRVLGHGGHYLMIECFTEGLRANNKARLECGLHELQEAYHNRYFDREEFLPAIRGLFTIVAPSSLSPEDGGQSLQSNFLSSHYFIARVLHPLVTKGDWLRNTEFVKFFSFLPPIGDYAPIQAYILRKTCEATPQTGGSGSIA